MAKDVLAVYDPCRVYLERFVSFASGQNEFGYKVRGYTDLSILAEQLQEEKIDAVLLALDEQCRLSFQENVITGLNRFGGTVLFMGRQQGSSEWSTFLKEAGFHGEVRYIWRYQSAREILRQIKGFLLEDREEETAPAADTPLFLAGMYSPVDKVSHPEAAAAILKEQGRVLYLNLEQFSGCSAVMDHACSSLSDILYCYKTTPGKLSEILFKSTGHAYGMDVLTAPDDLADLEELSEKEWPEFLRAVTRAGDYHYIFLDMSVFHWKLIDIVLTYGILYIPALPYDPGQTYRSVLIRSAGSGQRRMQIHAARMEEFRNYFLERGLEDELKKIREVRLETDG